MTRPFTLPTREDFPIPSYRDAIAVEPSDIWGIDEVRGDGVIPNNKVLFAAENVGDSWTTEGSGALRSGNVKDPFDSSSTLEGTNGLNASALAYVNASIRALYGDSVTPLGGGEEILRVNGDTGENNIDNYMAFKPSADVPVYEIFVINFNPTTRNAEAFSNGHAVVRLWRSWETVTTREHTFSSQGLTRFEVRRSVASSAPSLASGWEWLAVGGVGSDRNWYPANVRPSGSSKMAVVIRAPVGYVSDTDRLDVRGPRLASALYMGSNGNVTLQLVNGKKTKFTALVKGRILPVYTDKVFSTGTTATDIVALYETEERHVDV